MLGCHVVVTGAAGAGGPTLAAALTPRFGTALLSKDRVDVDCVWRWRGLALLVGSASGPR